MLMQDQAAVAPVSRSGLYLAGLALLLALATLFYAYLLSLPSNDGLTGDEMWAATVAGLSPLKTVLFTLRFDIHPPAYYLLLSLWGALARDDQFLLWSSVLAQLGLIALTYLFGSRVFSRSAALAAAILVAFSPLLAAYATELRMYSLLALLALIGAGLVHRLTDAAEADLRRPLTVAYVAACLAVMYSNASAFLIVGAHYGYGALRIGLPGRVRPHFRWFLLHLGIGALSAPALANSLIRSVQQGAAPSPAAALNTFSHLVSGRDLTAGPGPAILCLAAATAIISAAFAEREARRQLGAYLLVPFVLAFGLSHLLKPMWLDRIFVFAIPIVILATAGGVARLIQMRRQPVRSAAALGVAAVAALFAVTSAEDAMAARAPDLKALSAVIAARARPGDCVVTYEGLMPFWGLARYLGGPDWGDPLDIQEVPQERWATIVQKLGPQRARQFHLLPERNYVDVHGVRLWAGKTAGLDAACARETLLIARPKEAADFGGALGRRAMLLSASPPLAAWVLSR